MTFFPTSAAAFSALLPAALMLAAMGLAALPGRTQGIASDQSAWRRFRWMSMAATLAAALSLALQGGLHLASTGPALTPLAQPRALPFVALSLSGAWVALLVQLLGTAIGVFSSRYLEGERGQARYAAALCGVLAAVQVLLLADHWLLLIGSWAAAGIALQHLLCFYADRPFAQLAAHKKRVADRLADGLLLTAAGLSAWEVGSGSLTALRDHLAAGPASSSLQIAAVCLALAVLLRTALLPMHGWLIQVMEAPTPVSALLHAGVVNLGGWVLIRFAPLLEAAPVARWLLVGAGLLTAVLAGLVMLTRISIKVRLAWSTVAQMGFMVMECGLGLYSLALLHLLGHSLYKAHAFLMASSVVDESRRADMRGSATATLPSLLMAPAAAAAVVLGLSALVSATVGTSGWPLWWTALLALAWAPLMWSTQSAGDATRTTPWRQTLTGLAMVAGLTCAALLGHALPFGVTDTPEPWTGWAAVGGMGLLYVCLVLMQSGTDMLSGWRRRSYAGFYIDEYVTRWTLQVWPTRWASPLAQ
ncbi:NADH-quinone oxidoreductase subunit L [Roseateles terrae]|uniref:Probable inorganic carbon transporter subunit DabB n=1 Tax=Roseateles terrae TaxID=431060 RepID=A0ABR6GTC4_9BURK|nr:NADH-quinone oxidoreductase subunit L [Roseateles terrae]MBB3195353.1 NAD(P)H-quinone oxidoreductase subunit 5 [Roseateles terrae]